MDTPTTVKKTTLQGYAVMITGMIFIDKNDLRQQAEIPTLIADIQDGEKPLTDLVDKLKDVEFKFSFSRKQYPEDQAKALMASNKEPNKTKK